MAVSGVDGLGVVLFFMVGGRQHRSGLGRGRLKLACSVIRCGKQGELLFLRRLQ